MGARHIGGTHAGYDIYCKNRLFLRQAGGIDVGMTDESTELTPRLKRHEAYAIARLLNQEKDMLRWAKKFSDPYR